MALQIDYNSNLQDAVHTNAYFRVNIVLKKSGDDWVADYKGCYYTDSNWAGKTALGIYDGSHTVDLSADDDPVKQVYTHLKTLDDFSGAVDV